jgi:hypothetical protein
MASEATTVLLALIGIAVIVVGLMILIQLQKPPQMPRGSVEYPADYQWRGHYYSHIPIRPIMSAY